MRTALLTGMTTLVATAAIATPALAQTTAPTTPTQPTTGPQVSIGTCKIRHSVEGNGFTYANCLISVSNLAPGQSIKVNYKSNLKTYSPPGAEFGGWGKQTGTLAFSGGEIRGIQLGFPGKTAAQVKKSLKITLSSPTPGVTGTVATA